MHKGELSLLYSTLKKTSTIFGIEGINGNIYGEALDDPSLSTTNHKLRYEWDRRLK